MANTVLLRQKYGNIVLNSGEYTDFSRYWHYAFGIQKKKILLISDAKVYSLYRSKIDELLGNVPHSEILPVILEVGEGLKSLANLNNVWLKLSEAQFTTRDIIVALGGGTVTDLAGFAAATYKRGMKSVFVPTTLLASTDAALGGKNGINFNEYKNHVGGFHLPKLTFIDTSFFKTLDDEEILSGFAEMFKHGLLSGKKLYYDVMKVAETPANVSLSVLADSVRFKLKIAGNDPMEKSKRSILNFGHTLGHAIESFMAARSTPVSHGRAVAWGMQFALHVSADLFGLNAAKAKKNMEVLSLLFGRIPAINFEDLRPYLCQDKKNVTDKIGFIVLPDLGKAIKTDMSLKLFEKEYISFIIISTK